MTFRGRRGPQKPQNGKEKRNERESKIGGIHRAVVGAWSVYGGSDFERTSPCCGCAIFRRRGGVLRGAKDSGVGVKREAQEAEEVREVEEKVKAGSIHATERCKQALSAE